MRLGHEQVAADRGQVADRGRGDRLDRASQELDLATDLRERCRRTDRDGCALRGDPGQARRGAGSRATRWAARRGSTCVPPAISVPAPSRPTASSTDVGRWTCIRSPPPGCVSLPTLSTSTSTTSPCLSERFGSMNSPTPQGVPVRITSPGSSVKRVRAEADQLGDAEDHLRGVGVLQQLAVDLRGHAQVLRVVDLDELGPERAEGVQALGAHPLDVGELQVARGDVVGDRVAADVGERVLLGDVARFAVDHDRQLDLPVDALGQPAGDPDLVAVADHRRRELAEHERLGRRLHP